MSTMHDEAWGIKNPHGQIIISTITLFPKEARAKLITQYFNNLSWPELSRRGYKCIRLRITEAK